MAYLIVRSENKQYVSICHNFMPCCVKNFVPYCLFLRINQDNGYPEIYKPVE